MKPLTIIFYYKNAFNPTSGGVERISVVLGEEFVRKGMTVYFLSDEVDTQNCDIRNNLFFPADNALSNEKNMDFLRMFIKKHHVDIIINQAGFFPCCKNLGLCKGNAKIISVLHNTLDGIYSYPNNNFLPYKLKKYSYLKPFRCLYRTASRIKYKSFYRSLVNMSDKICLLSESYRKEALYYTNCRKEQLAAIPNCITLSPPINIDEKEKKVLFVGRLEWQKRPELMLEIWKSLGNKTNGWSLYFAGEGFLYEKLARRIKRENLKNVHLLGRINPEPYYMKSAILCMTSCYEGFALVLLEAMNYHVVPIVFNSFLSTADIVNNGEDGFLIDEGDIESYKKALLQAMSQPVSEKMKHKMNEKVQKYSLSNITEQWVQLFQNIIKDV